MIKIKPCKPQEKLNREKATLMNENENDVPEDIYEFSYEQKLLRTPVKTSQVKSTPAL